jgi:hypothetical protein
MPNVQGRDAIYDRGKGAWNLPYSLPIIKNKHARYGHTTAFSRTTENITELARTEANILDPVLRIC